MTGTPPVYIRQDGHCEGQARAFPFVGSREHYFHFLIGYLLPLVHLAVTRRVRRIPFFPLPPMRALHCGPVMTPILSETFQRLGVGLELFEVGDRFKPRYVPAWDHRPDWVKMAETASLVRKVWRDVPCTGKGCATGENLLLQRSAAPDYYASSKVEVKGYGAARRAIANLDEISAALAARGIAHSCYQPGEHTLSCQMTAFAGAKRICGIRGAEWANMVWTEPGQVDALVIYPGKPSHLLPTLLSHYAPAAHFTTIDSDHPQIELEPVAAFFEGRELANRV